MDGPNKFVEIGTKQKKGFKVSFVLDQCSCLYPRAWGLKTRWVYKPKTLRFESQEQEDFKAYNLFLVQYKHTRA
jgi:hypothetical protein